MSNKKILTALRIVLLVIVSLAVGIQLYSWNARTLAGNALPMPFGVGAAVVMSGSMEPELFVDDLVIIRQTQDYAVDDIVVYQSGNSLVIHRIVEMDGELVIAQGDANNAPDDPIHMRYIKGELAAVFPGVGGLFRVLKSFPVTLALLAVAVFLLESSWRKQKKQDTDELDKIKAEIRALQKELNDQ